MIVTSSNWKRVELRVADLLDGERIPVSGRGRGDAPDIQHDWLSIEVKHRKKLPAWLMNALHQAEVARRSGQLPVVVLHQRQQPYKDSLVLLRLEDFTDWFVGRVDSDESQPARADADELDGSGE